MFVEMVNGCFKDGTFPDIFKRVRIMPLYKGGNWDDYSNFRPTSLLPIFSRIFEKLIYVQFYVRMEQCLEKDKNKFS